MSFEYLKNAIIAAGTTSWLDNGNRRGFIATRRVDHCNTAPELHALNLWVSVGWEGLDEYDLELLDAVIAREARADRDKRRELEFELELLDANRSDRAARDSTVAKR